MMKMTACIIIFLFVTHAQGQSTSELFDSLFNNLPPETTQAEPSLVAPVSGDFILPRPSGAPQPQYRLERLGGNNEHNLCYNYRNLLARNGGPTISDDEELLRAVYAHGRIVIHMTASRNTPTQYMNFHIRDRGWADIGYHFMITPQGQVITGRSLHFMGAHAAQIPNREDQCRNNNYMMDEDPDYRAIGIALIGNFELESPSSAQISALQRLVEYLQSRFNIAEVKPHSHFQSTSCPGRHFNRAVNQSIYQPLTAERQSLMRQSTSPFFPNDSNSNRRFMCYSCQ
jgi:hypothetical protein